MMVGASGFEPPTSASRTLRAKPDCATPRRHLLYGYNGLESKNKRIVIPDLDV